MRDRTTQRAAREVPFGCALARSSKSFLRPVSFVPIIARYKSSPRGRIRGYFTGALHGNSLSLLCPAWTIRRKHRRQPEGRTQRAWQETGEAAHQGIQECACDVYSREHRAARFANV